MVAVADEAGYVALLNTRQKFKDSSSYQENAGEFEYNGLLIYWSGDWNVDLVWNACFTLFRKSYGYWMGCSYECHIWRLLDQGTNLTQSSHFFFFHISSFSVLVHLGCFAYKVCTRTIVSKSTSVLNNSSVTISIRLKLSTNSSATLCLCMLIHAPYWSGTSG